MSRALIALVFLAACIQPETAERARDAVSVGAPKGQTVSSMNYAMERVDPTCALAAVRDTDGFAVRGGLSRDGNGQRFAALFNGDLPLTVIVRPGPRGERTPTAEVSVFTRLTANPSPLAEREAEFAVRAADEAIYRACTRDGQDFPKGDGDVVIEAE